MQHFSLKFCGSAYAREVHITSYFFAKYTREYYLESRLIKQLAALPGVTRGQ